MTTDMQTSIVRAQLREAETALADSLAQPTASLRMQALHNRFFAMGADEREALALAALTRLAISMPERRPG